MARHSSPRPILSDISGDETERFYFHCFRRIAGRALSIRHKHNALFWEHVVPAYCLEVPAVKHAFVALGAAYHHFQTQGLRTSLLEPPSETERFVIRQYNLALKGLTDEVRGVPVRRLYGITLISCVAFFCIEVLRNDFLSAQTHLSNGLQLMANLPDEVADMLQNPEKWSRGSDTSLARVVYMFKLLCRWELSTRLVTCTFRPHLTLQIFDSRKLSSRAESCLPDEDQLYEAVDGFCQDVSAFAWLTKHHRGDDDYWAQPWPRKQHSILLERSKAISNAFNDSFWSDRHLIWHVSRLRHCGASLVLELLPFPVVIGTGRCLEPFEVSGYREFKYIAANIRALLSRPHGSRTAGTNVDMGVIPALYMTASVCRDTETKNGILDMMREWPQEDSLWDGAAMRNMLDMEGIRRLNEAECTQSAIGGPTQGSAMASVPGMWF